MHVLIASAGDGARSRVEFAIAQRPEGLENPVDLGGLEHPRPAQRAGPAHRPEDVLEHEHAIERERVVQRLEER
jgi:hypothetical protein